nr:glycosyltransferase [Pseudoalteromonas luteoviolacea]
MSIVTPTYNRAHILSDSLSSSLKLVEQGYAQEIILVDDCSSDDTIENVKLSYEKEIASGVIKLVELPENLGVTGAKNVGVENASGEWVAFMDSDDIFLAGSGELLAAELNRLNKMDLIFFRCSDLESKELIGAPESEKEIDIRRLLNRGTPGECLPVMKRKAAQKFPYNVSLRGCESLAYLQLASQKYKVFLSDKIIRGYDSSGDDRLSTRKAIKSRSDKLIKYHYKRLKFVKHASLTTFIGVFVRILYYSGIRLIR